jgi:DNA-binding MarR family transcriptional regulator
MAAARTSDRRTTDHRTTDRRTTDPAAVELGLAVTRFRARMRAETATAEGWTISQLSTLSRLIKEGPMTASALAQAEHVRPQSIAEMVAVLRDDGLVAAEPDPTDRRKSLLTATEAGHRLVDDVKAARGTWLAQAIDAVIRPEARGDLAIAIDVLNRLAECELGADTDHGWRA